MTPAPMQRVTESAASSSTARAYDLIRSELGSGFVPSIYQVLAACPPALDAAVEVLPRVVAVARDADFPARVCALVATELAAVDGGELRGTRALDDASRDVILGYRSANPLNLLLALALLGTGVPEWPGVMTAVSVSAPAPTDANPSLEDEITLAHGGVLLPGLWRDLLSISSASDPWSEVRAFAADGSMPSVRAQVRALAEQVLHEGHLATADGILGRPLPLEVPHLTWFPTGIATMIVEAEVLVSSSPTSQ
ncbi:unannotated protein [freshwater metagenome]|uniref:Unannotated protein n=1 Tax=freshwater metagenome TaxID=449393 RepID=A0A6J7L050_9ZZZZ